MRLKLSRKAPNTIATKTELSIFNSKIRRVSYIFIKRYNRQYQFENLCISNINVYYSYLDYRCKQLHILYVSNEMTYGTDIYWVVVSRK